MAQLKGHFREFISDPKRRRIYEREALAFEASELISRLMEEQQVSKTDLARLVGQEARPPQLGIITRM